MLRDPDRTGPPDSSPDPDSPSESFLNLPELETERSMVLDFERLQPFAQPIGVFETEKVVGKIIGVGYTSMEHPSERVQYRGISRTVKRHTGPDLVGDTRVAVYCGWDRVDPYNEAIGWEAVRLSGKSLGRIGIAFGIAYPPGERYDRLVHVPYLTDGHHPIGLALTVDTALADDGRLVVMGPSGRGGREEVVELTKAEAMAALQDKQLGQRLVRLRNKSLHRECQSGQSGESSWWQDYPRLREWRSLKWSLERVRRGESPHSPRLANTLHRLQGARP